MATFDYVALDAGGRRQKGVLSADNARSARRQLQDRNLTLLDLKEARSRSVKAGSAQTKPQRTSMSARERVVITRQLAMLIRASTPIDEALALVAEQSEKPRLRRALLQMRGRVSEGARLSEAMADAPGLFDGLYNALVSAGESSGKLGEVMERLADHLEASQKMARKIQAALIYPALLTLVAGAVVTLLMVFVVPRVVDQFDSLGRDLPLITEIVIAISAFLQRFGLLVLAGLGGLIAVFVIGRRTPGVRLAVDGALLRLPLVGSALRTIDAARFCRTFSTLIDAGTPAFDAMRAAIHVIGNEATRSRLRTAARLVGEGSPVGSALRKTDTFPPMVVHMAGAGERAGQLHSMLARSADYLESDFEARNQTLLSLLEPVIIIVMGAIVAVIVLSIMLPILQLNTLAMI